jgi:hypothetical protein
MDKIRIELCLGFDFRILFILSILFEYSESHRELWFYEGHHRPDKYNQR